MNFTVLGPHWAGDQLNSQRTLHLCYITEDYLHILDNWHQCQLGPTLLKQPVQVARDSDDLTGGLRNRLSDSGWPDLTLSSITISPLPLQAGKTFSDDCQRQATSDTMQGTS